MLKEKNTDTKKTRRGHGEGTTYQRGDGYWIGQITIGKDEDGNQQRKTFSAKSQKELGAKMKEYQYQQMKGDLPKTDTISLGSWMTTWLETYKKPKLRQTTYENYDALTKTHILNTALSKTQVQKLTTDQIQKYLKLKAEKGRIVIAKEEVEENGKKIIKETKEELPLSNRTVNLILFLIQSCLNQAVKNNIVVKNVAHFCERYKDDKKEIKPLSSEGSKQLLQVVKKHRLFAVVLLDLATGLRRGELLALKWKNVDLEEGHIKIVENLVRIKGGSRIQKPKTDSSIRTIQLPERVKEALKLHQVQQEAEKATIAKKIKEYEKLSKEKKAEEKPVAPYEDNDLVFCQANGKPIEPRNFQRMIKGWIIKAGLPKETRLHDLRHTFVTNMFAAGVDIKTVQSFTGHADTRTLLDTYAHVIGESQKKAAELMNDILPNLNS